MRTHHRAAGRETGGHRRLGPVVVVAATVLPVVLSLAWIPVRRDLPDVDVALVLVLAVTASGATGRRICVAAGAAGAAAGFAFFDTEPYERWVISRQPDLETLVVLAVVSVLTGELAVRAVHLRGDRSGPGPRRADVDRVREIAALVASGAELATVLAAIGTELVRLLGASSCTYEAGAAPPDHFVVDRDGAVRRPPAAGPVPAARPPAARPVPAARPPAGADVDVPVTGMAQVLGRFVVARPDPVALTVDHLLVALTLADQAGAALIAQAPESAAGPAPPGPRPALRVVD